LDGVPSDREASEQEVPTVLIRRPLACISASLLTCSIAYADEALPVTAAGVFPVEIVETEKPIPVKIESQKTPLLVEVQNPPPSPAEVYITGILPVAVVGGEPAECKVTRFTVLGLTSAKYAGGSLGGPLGTAQKCQAEFGDFAVMCRAAFVKEDLTALPQAGDLYAWVDEVEGLEANCTGPLPRQSDPQILGSATKRWSCLGTKKLCTVSSQHISNVGSVVSPDLSLFNTLACEHKRPIACCGWSER
jgi:hypothetical protein